MSEISKRIKQVRNDKKLSQDAFALAISEKENSLKGVEYGKQRATAEMAQSIVEIFQINARWLLTGEGDMYASDSRKRRPSVPTQRKKDAKKECLVMKNENIQRLVDFLSYYDNVADDNDLAWLEGHIKRSVPEYAEFVLRKKNFS